MKYVLLDTNILIDMVVDRRNQMSSNLLESFIKLLEYDEIKLIVPEIVEFETYKHLEKELDQVGKNIKDLVDKIKKLYGVTTHNTKELNIQEFKKESQKQLNQILTMFSNERDNYKNALFDTMKMVFEHRNSIHVLDDDQLNNLVMKRRIFKKAPFHKEKKESYADGLITETLINLKKYIELKDNDIIYFVTGNYTDFCDTENNKNLLHPHILQDLQKEGFSNQQVIYVCSFGKLIQEELKGNVENAKLTEEFKKELEREQEEEKEISEKDYQDLLRESVGLSPFGDYTSMMEDGLLDSQFQQDVVTYFEKINTCYRRIENFEGLYFEELPEYMEKCKISDHETTIEIFQSLFQMVEGPKIENKTILDLEIILDWIKEQEYRLQEIPFDKELPDNISFGDKIIIFDCNHKEFTFEIDELYLSPENGSRDQIDIRIESKTKEICAQGDISITYGFIETDDDGCIGDGCEEDIEYNYQDIIDNLEKIYQEWEQFIKKQEKIYDYLNENLLKDYLK